MEAIQPENVAHPQSRMAALADFCAFAAAEPDGDRIIARTLEVLASCLALDHAVFLMLSPGLDALVVHAQRGWEGHGIEGEQRSLDFSQIPALPSPGGELIELGSTVENVAFFPEELLRLRSFCGGLAVLLHAGALPLGIVAVLSVGQRRFTGEEKEFALAVAGMVSAVLGPGGRQGARLRQALVAKREWLTAVDGLTELVFVLDERGRVLRTNRAVEGLVEGGVFNARGRDVHEFVHPECRSEHCTVRNTLRRVYERALAGGSSQEDIRDGASERQWRLRATRCGGSQARETDLAVPGIVLLIDDVTEERNRQRALHEERLRLEQTVGRLSRRIRCLERMRHRQKARIRDLRSELIEAGEVERRRVAAELHDGIGQSLTALKFWVEANLLECRGRKNTSSPASVCKSTVRRIQQSIDEVRRISLNLRPSMLDDLGLVVTLNWLCREFQAAHPGLELVKDIACDDSKVPERLKNVIFRVAQEALNNVAKHAKAANAGLSVHCDETATVLRIVDDGCGLEAAAAMKLETHTAGGLGLKSMRERAEASGGRFELVTSGDGTSIEVSWRFPNEPGKRGVRSVPWRPENGTAG